MGLSADGPLRALRHALTRRRCRESALVHHSNRGLPYCSGAYVTELEAAGVAVLMT